MVKLGERLLGLACWFVKLGATVAFGSVVVHLVNGSTSCGESWLLCWCGYDGWISLTG